MILALLAGVAIAGLIFHLERKDRRHDRQVQQLLQRIQDPGAAVAQHVIQQTEEYPVAHLPFDDDAAWLTHVEGLNGK